MEGVSLERVLQLAHILVILCVLAFGWGAYRVALFKNKGASLWLYLGLFVLGMLALSLLVHWACNVKTRLGYYLGLCPYPKYRLY